MYFSKLQPLLFLLFSQPIQTKRTQKIFLDNDNDTTTTLPTPPLELGTPIKDLKTNTTVYTNQVQALDAFSPTCQATLNNTVLGIQQNCLYQQNIFPFYTEALNTTGGFVSDTRNYTALLKSINDLIKPFCQDLSCSFQMAGTSNAVLTNCPGNEPLLNIWYKLSDYLSNPKQNPMCNSYTTPQTDEEANFKAKTTLVYSYTYATLYPNNLCGAYFYLMLMQYNSLLQSGKTPIELKGLICNSCFRSVFGTADLAMGMLVLATGDFVPVGGDSLYLGGSAVPDLKTVQSVCGDVFVGLNFGVGRGGGRWWGVLVGVVGIFM